jgi:hypothetical protein
MTSRTTALELAFLCLAISTAALPMAYVVAGDASPFQAITQWPVGAALGWAAFRISSLPQSKRIKLLARFAFLVLLVSATWLGPGFKEANVGVLFGILLAWFPSALVSRGTAQKK